MNNTDWVLFICMFCAALFLGAVIGSTTTREYWERQSVERGYALHCPSNGGFAWKGECDD